MLWDEVPAILFLLLDLRDDFLAFSSVELMWFIQIRAWWSYDSTFNNAYVLGLLHLAFLSSLLFLHVIRKYNFTFSLVIHGVVFKLNLLSCFILKCLHFNFLLGIDIQYLLNSAIYTLSKFFHFFILFPNGLDLFLRQIVLLFLIIKLNDFFLELLWHLNFNGILFAEESFKMFKLLWVIAHLYELDSELNLGIHRQRLVFG